MPPTYFDLLCNDFPPSGKWSGHNEFMVGKNFSKFKRTGKMNMLDVLNMEIKKYIFISMK
jgi:hypothetical protein